MTASRKETTASHHTTNNSDKAMSEHTAALSSYNGSFSADDSSDKDCACFEGNTIGQVIASLFHFGKNAAIDVPRGVDKSETTVNETAGANNDEMTSSASTFGFSPEETQILLELHQRLGQHYSSGKEAKSEDTATENGKAQSIEKTGPETDSGFLMTLATCAAQRAAQGKTYNVEQSQDDTEGEVISQEEVMHRLLDKAKREAEAKKQTTQLTGIHLHHVQHVNQHVLPSGFEQMLQSAFIAEESTIISEQCFLETMSKWLGCQGDDALLDLVFGEVSGDDSLANAIELSGWFYRLAVALYTLEQSLGEAEVDKDGNISTVEFGPLQTPTALARSLIETAREVEEKRAAMRNRIQEMRRESGLSLNDDKSLHANEESHANSVPAEGMVARDVFKFWHKAYFPAVASSLSLFMRQIVFPTLQAATQQPRLVRKQTSVMSNASDTTGMSSQEPGLMFRKQSSVTSNASEKVIKEKKTHLFPVLDHGTNQDGDFFTSPISPLAYALTCMSNENFGRKWHRLYTTSSDGLSINRLEHSINGYDGPTLFLLRAFVDDESGKTATFGAYASSPWKKKGSTEFFGGSDCFLYQMYPRVKVMRTSNNARGGNYQYFHVGGSAAKNSKIAKGIGFGGSASQPRLFIPTSLDKCYAGPTDTSFEPGELVPCDSGIGPWWFDLDCLEIWGLGDDYAMGARNNYRSTMDSHLRKARKVDKAAFLNDFRTGLIESKMFDFRQQMRDRDGGCLLDCDPDDSDWQIGPR